MGPFTYDVCTNIRFYPNLTQPLRALPLPPGLHNQDLAQGPKCKDLQCCSYTEILQCKFTNHLSKSPLQNLLFWVLPSSTLCRRHLRSFPNGSCWQANFWALPPPPPSILNNPPTKNPTDRPGMQIQRGAPCRELTPKLKNPS